MNQIPSNSLFCGREHLHFPRIDSTNTEAQKLCRNKEVNEGLLITAEIQEKGRGYAGNEWVTEAGKNVTMTLVLKPNFIKAKWQFYLNQAVTLGIYDALGKTLDKTLLKIKWPNDVLYNGKKLCGILIENTLQSEYLQYSFVGIGINVNQVAFPSDLKHATSVARITGVETDLPQLIGLLCENIEARYLALKNNNIETLQRDYMKHLYRFEEWSNYMVEGKEMQGRITRLTPEGKLVLETEAGEKEFGFKEVEFVL